MKTFSVIFSLSVLAATSGCVGAGAGNPEGAPLTKEEAAALGGKSDSGADWCLEYGWYGDGVCDSFCLKPDPDCEAEGECRKTGCSSHVCADEDVFTTCEVVPGAECYQTAACERQADGECGFTSTPELEACLESAGADEEVWLSYSPTQCGSNPWQMDPQPTDGIALGGELAEIVAYYRSIGITIEEIGLVDPAEPIAVCLACQCPRGDRLVVKAQGASAGLLESLGFQPLEGGLGISPIQCGGNPWNDPSVADSEHRQVVEWSDELGADLVELGFIQPVEPPLVCEACSCPRGDFLIVLPEAVEDAAVLEAEGFSQL